MIGSGGFNAISRPTPDYQGTLTRKSSLCCIGYLGSEHRRDRRDVGFLLEDTVDNCIIFSLKEGSLKSLSGSTSQSAYEPQRHTRQVQVCTSQCRGLASAVGELDGVRGWPCYRRMQKCGCRF
jgi:hypothetical protein